VGAGEDLADGVGVGVGDVLGMALGAGVDDGPGGGGVFVTGL